MERKPVTLDDIERRLVEQHIVPFHNWLRQLVSLSSGTLTLLVGLQNHYIPQHPTSLWLLRVCWGCLAIAVLSGLVALRGEWQNPLDAFSALRRKRANHGDAAAAADIEQNSSHAPRFIFRAAVQITFWCFILSVLTLAAFAILNLGVMPQPAPKA
jgi:hypothetical protein